MLVKPKPCGDCGLCCTVLDIAELQKPSDAVCRHFAKGRGCSIHSDRPNACRSYQCIWTLAGPLGGQWRPDRAGFLLTPTADPSHVEILVDPARPDAWRSEPYYSQFKQWSHQAHPDISRVLVRSRGRMIVVFPEADIDLGPPNGMRHIEWGYEEKDGRIQPFARFAPGPGGSAPA